jgi:septal ring factor EnvC (AmiA/AmiB activator)
MNTEQQVAKKVSLVVVMQVASSCITIIIVLCGAFAAYVVSKTQVQDNQLEISRRLTEIQLRIDEQTKASLEMERSIARIDQTIADLKIAVVPKH